MSNWINFTREEAFPFRIESPNVKLSEGFCLNIPVDFTATIKYRTSEDWEIDGITVTGWNGKYWKENETWGVELDRFPDLYKRVVDYIYNFCREDVETAIDEAELDRYNDARLQEGKDRRLDAAE